MTLALRDPAPPDSPLARWDARWKLAAVVVSAIATSFLETVSLTAAAAAFTLGLAVLGRIPNRAIFGRIGLLLLAVVPVFVVVPLAQPGSDSGWDLGFVRVSIPGLLAAFAIAFRILAVGISGLILARTGPFPQVLAAAHALLIPGVLVQIAQLAYRYTFLFTTEAWRTRIALRTRGFRPRTDRLTYRTLGHATGGLLVRSADRAEAVAAAMRCRGFDGTYRTLATFRTSPYDVLGFAAVAAVSLGLVALDRFGVA